MAQKKKQKVNVGQIISMIFGGAVGFFLAFFCLKKGDEAEISFGSDMLEIGIAIIAFLVIMYLAVIIHEAGHLVMGLLTGYKFLSFRVGSLVLQKTEQGLKFKKYSIAGTGGQCLMCPPDVENPEDVPYFWYNFGGGLFNFLTAALCVPFLFADNSTVRLIFIMTAAVSAIIGLTNIIPLDMGVTNDGMNILLMAKDSYVRGVLYKQLKLNELQTKGMRTKDIPEKLFEYDENHEDKLSASHPAFTAARLIDEFRFEEAEKLLEWVIEKYPLAKFYLNEYNCELLFCKLVNGADKAAIDELYDKELQQYVKASGKTMITRRKLMYAYYLIIEKNAELAEKEYQLAYKMEKNYPNVGEAKSELAVLEYVKANFS